MPALPMFFEDTCVFTPLRTWHWVVNVHTLFVDSSAVASSVTPFLHIGAQDSSRSEVTGVANSGGDRAHSPALPAPGPQHGLCGCWVGLSFGVFLAADPLAPGLVPCVRVCVCVCVYSVTTRCVCVCVFNDYLL